MQRMERDFGYGVRYTIKTYDNIRWHVYIGGEPVVENVSGFESESAAADFAKALMIRIAKRILILCANESVQVSQKKKQDDE